MTDKRYTIERESKNRFVIRFCGEQIGISKTNREAQILASSIWRAARIAEREKEEILGETNGRRSYKN